MRKIFLLLSVVLLYFVTILANPPPMVIGTDDSQNETVIKNSLDQPVDVINMTAIEIGEITSPLVFSVPGFPVQAIVTAESGTSDVIDNTAFRDIQSTENLLQVNSQNKRLNLDERSKTNKVVDLSRLDIGEFYLVKHQ